MTDIQSTPIISRQNTSLSTIYFYLTKECNLACRHCWISPKFKNIKVADEYLSLDLLKSIIDQAIPLGLTDIKLSGGEPLLHPDILDILSIARDRDLCVNVETNGTLVTKEFTDSISSCNKKFISVSLDGVDAPTHDWVRGVKGSFDLTLNGIRILVGAGLKPQIIMSLFRRNIDQIEPLLSMAEKMGAGSVKCNIIQPSARGLSVYANNETLTIEEIIRISAMLNDSVVKKYSIPLFFSIPPAFRPMSNIFGNGGHCCSCNICHIIGVLGDGSYALCGIGETIPELIFGHATKDPLEFVWNNNPVIREIREGLPGKLTGICAQCAMKSICKGSCIAQNFFRSKELWAPYWFCDASHEQNLFPKNRIFPKNSV